jgi:hypothetical protein
MSQLSIVARILGLTLVTFAARVSLGGQFLQSINVLVKLTARQGTSCSVIITRADMPNQYLLTPSLRQVRVLVCYVKRLRLSAAAVQNARDAIVSGLTASLSQCIMRWRGLLRLLIVLCRI